MTNYARIINDVAVDVSTDPSQCFHPDLVPEFTPVPDDVVVGSYLKDGVWYPPIPAPEPEPIIIYPSVTPIEFKMLFTTHERVAIRQARENDLVIDDFFDLLDDVRVTTVDMALGSVQDMVKYLADKELIKPERVQQILTNTQV